MLSFLTTAFVAALLLVEVSGSATCSGTPGLATVKLQEASKLQEEHSDAYLLSEEDEEFELPELELPKTMQPPMPPAILTRAWTLPYLTELPTPLPDLLVLLVALASFSLFRKLQDVLSDACEAEPVQRQTRQREETMLSGAQHSTELHSRAPVRKCAGCWRGGPTQTHGRRGMRLLSTWLRAAAILRQRGC